jgi:hypothetical protein
VASTEKGDDRRRKCWRWRASRWIGYQSDECQARKLFKAIHRKCKLWKAKGPHATGVHVLTSLPLLSLKKLSYEIDDDAITKFFGALDSEVKAVRWLHHKDSGDFKGV